MPAHLAGDGERQRRNRPRELTARAGELRDGQEAGNGTAMSPAGYRVPAVPFVLSKELRERWDGIWTSPLAMVLDPVTDYAIMERLFWSYRQHHRLRRMVARADPAKLAEHFARGDFESLEVAEIAAAIDKLNQTMGTILKLQVEIRMTEQQLGLSPRARLGLGVMIKAAGGGGAAGGDDDDDDWGDDDD